MPGGASLQNRQGFLKRGDIVELSFSPETGKHALVARVLRISNLGTVAHVKFEPLSETERKKIMTFVLAQSRVAENSPDGMRPWRRSTYPIMLRMYPSTIAPSIPHALPRMAPASTSRG